MKFMLILYFAIGVKLAMNAPATDPKGECSDGEIATECRPVCGEKSCADILAGGAGGVRKCFSLRCFPGCVCASGIRLFEPNGGKGQCVTKERCEQMEKATNET
uniref:TIL domain-containing protein n=1 Tax=Globodera rostochiensis TaxID=31243 RepID=A0A914HXL2_GLORO